MFGKVVAAGAVLGVIASFTFGAGAASAGFEFGVKPSSGVQSSYFGFGVGEQVVLFGGLDFLRVSASLESEQGDADAKATVLMPNVGAKFYLGPREDGEVAPYLLASVFKANTSFDVDVEGMEIPEDTMEQIEDILSPFGVNAAFGAEYYFSDNFSMLGEYGVRYVKSSAELDTEIGEMGPIQADLSISAIHHTVGFGVNFRF